MTRANGAGTAAGLGIGMESSKLLEGLLALVADYLSFVLRFPRDPRGVLKPHAASGKVEKDLTGLFLAGIGASYLLLVVLKPAGLETDPSAIVAWFRTLDLHALPPAILGITVVFSLALHAMVRIYEWLSHVTAKRALPRRLLSGTIEDTVNGALAFGAIAAPATILGFALTFWTAARIAPAYAMAPVVVFSLAWASFVGIYLPWALAAAHGGTTFWQAVRACWGGAFLIIAPFVLFAG